MKTNARLLPLALFLLLSIVPLTVFAEEIEPTAAHTHSYYIDEDFGYAPIDNSNHKK